MQRYLCEDEIMCPGCSWQLGPPSYPAGNNIFTNNILTGSTYGFDIKETTANTFINNLITGNSYGIRLNISSDNNITNNFFNNTVNAIDDGLNIWNTTKTPGTNIIGGPFRGGNFWSDYIGIDTNGDELGDTNLPYNSDGFIQNGGDFLPLTMPLPLNLVSDDTEDSSSCSGNCHTSWIRGADEQWGSVAADVGNCTSRDERPGPCTPNWKGTGIVEEYNWNSNFLNNNVTLESKYEIRANGMYNVSCYNGASWQSLFGDSGARYPWIITHNVTVPSSCIIDNQSLKVKHTIYGVHPMAPTFYYESRIGYWSS